MPLFPPPDYHDSEKWKEAEKWYLQADFGDTPHACELLKISEAEYEAMKTAIEKKREATHRLLTVSTGFAAAVIGACQVLELPLWGLVPFLLCMLLTAIIALYADFPVVRPGRMTPQDMLNINDDFVMRIVAALHCNIVGLHVVNEWLADVQHAALHSFLWGMILLPIGLFVQGLFIVP